MRAGRPACDGSKPSQIRTVSWALIPSTWARRRPADVPIIHRALLSVIGPRRPSAASASMDRAEMAGNRSAGRTPWRNRGEHARATPAGRSRWRQAAAAVNATRNAIFGALCATGLPVEAGDGARTKCNRPRQGYPKAHWIDAACVGASGAAIALDPRMRPLRVQACGHGVRQRCRPDAYGVPRPPARREKTFAGYRTGRPGARGHPIREVRRCPGRPHRHPAPAVLQAHRRRQDLRRTPQTPHQNPGGRRLCPRMSTAAIPLRPIHPRSGGVPWRFSRWTEGKKELLSPGSTM